MINSFFLDQIKELRTPSFFKHFIDNFVILAYIMYKYVQSCSGLCQPKETWYWNEDPSGKCDDILQTDCTVAQAHRGLQSVFEGFIYVETY